MASSLKFPASDAVTARRSVIRSLSRTRFWSSLLAPALLPGSLPQAISAGCLREKPSAGEVRLRTHERVRKRCRPRDRCRAATGHGDQVSEHLDVDGLLRLARRRVLVLDQRDPHTRPSGRVDRCRSHDVLLPEMAPARCRRRRERQRHLGSPNPRPADRVVPELKVRRRRLPTVSGCPSHG